MAIQIEHLHLNLADNQLAATGVNQMLKFNVDNTIHALGSNDTKKALIYLKCFTSGFLVRN
jgi:hypothetical protein